MKTKTLALALCILPLAACASTGSAPVFQSEMTANAKNTAAQHVAPTDQQKSNTFIPHDPQVRQAARERYRTGNVKEPVRETTQ